MHDGMMWGMVPGGLIPLVIAVLIAALIKYLTLPVTKTCADLQGGLMLTCLRGVQASCLT